MFGKTEGKAKADERLAQSSFLTRILRRPELGALAGAIVVWVVFAILAGNRGFLGSSGVANYLEVASELGILAVGVSMLMIAGEFDLSIGSMIGASGMVTAVLTKTYGFDIWPALAISLAFALFAGFINGLMVVRTKLPSFIITLASLFIIRGATLGLTRLATNVTVQGQLNEVAGFLNAQWLFHGSFLTLQGVNERNVNGEIRQIFFDVPFEISILWWLGLALVATVILLRTPIGNWIFSVGGDEDAARNVGVPVDRVKIGLFMTTAFCAWLVAHCQVFEAFSADVTRGDQQEFFAIIAAVIGGTLLTGGYGSAIGAVLGALIFGIVKQGTIYTGAESDWFLVVLGGMLISAVLINNYVRKLAMEAK
jgi:simple sugar transport system permease protein